MAARLVKASQARQSDHAAFALAYGPPIARGGDRECVAHWRGFHVAFARRTFSPKPPLEGAGAVEEPRERSFFHRACTPRDFVPIFSRHSTPARAPSRRFLRSSLDDSSMSLSVLPLAARGASRADTPRVPLRLGASLVRGFTSLLAGNARGANANPLAPSRGICRRGKACLSSYGAGRSTSHVLPSRLSETAPAEFRAGKRIRDGSGRAIIANSVRFRQRAKGADMAKTGRISAGGDELFFFRGCRWTA